MALEAKVECHCRLTSFAISIPTSTLPLKSSLCHCHSCRHTTGQVFTTFAVIPLPLPAILLKSDDLAKYAVSTCERWFCKRCGASVINVDKGTEPEEWEVATGVLHFADEKGLEGRLKRVQLWVEDVKGDGGAVGWINRGKLEGMDRHWKARGSEMVDDETIKDLMGTRGRNAEDDNNRLAVQCKCQNVRFEVARPDQTHNHGTGKFESSLDACTSCRTVTGFEITSWTTVPRNAIAAGVDLDTFLADRSRLGHYQSSSNTSRYFCTTCGATVFYCRHGIDTIDISSGLFESNAEKAGRMEPWLDWKKVPGTSLPDKSSLSTEFVAFQGDAIDAQFVNNVAEGMEAWEKQIRT